MSSINSSFEFYLPLEPFLRISFHSLFERALLCTALCISKVLYHTNKVYLHFSLQNPLVLFY